MLPLYLIRGPYKVSTKLFFGVAVLALIAARMHINANETEIAGARAFEDAGDRSTGVDERLNLSLDTVKKLKLLGFLYGLGGLRHMKVTTGWWPLVSYTMQSWTWTTIRFLFGFLAMQFNSSFCRNVEEFARFPSLAQNTITFFVWWTVLVPVFTVTLSMKNKKALMGFLKWNFSPFLLTVHGINLPFAILGHLLTPRPLTLHDYWNACFVGLSYLTFYLSVLDYNELPIYFILSPRSNIGPATYSALLVAYYGIFKVINSHTSTSIGLLNYYLQ